MAISYFHIFINLFRNSQLRTVYSICTVRSRNEMTIITTVRYQANALTDTFSANRVQCLTLLVYTSTNNTVNTTASASVLTLPALYAQQSL